MLFDRTPVQTIGGGVVLDPNPLIRKSFKEPEITELITLERGSYEQKLTVRIGENRKLK